ncbi:MAG TPA: S41 family peptidase [Bacillota bacterium]|nr:S41 family peptidase [Bacillota bacterium]
MFINKKTIFYILLFSILGILSIILFVFPQKSNENLNANDLHKEFKQDFDFLYKEIRDNYVNLEYTEARYNFKWNDLYKRYKIEIAKAKTYKEFYKICTQYTSYLHDGHLRFSWIPSGVGKRLLEDHFLIRRAISLSLVEDKVIITESIDKEILGQEVIKINGIPIQEILEVMMKHYYIATDDYQTKARLLYRNLYLDYFDLYFDEYPASLIFEIMRPGNKISQFTLATEEESYHNQPSHNLAPFLIEDRSRLPYGKIIDNRFGYIKIPTFSGKAKEITDAFRKLAIRFKNKGVQAAIIDLRGNGGGNCAREILGFLAPTKIIKNRYRYKNTDRFKKLYGIGRLLYEDLRSPSFKENLEKGYTKWWGWVLTPKKENYLTSIPVAVIYDDLIFSDGIGFVTTCRNLELAKIIGPSMELTNHGLTKPVTLPGKHFSIAYSVMEFRKPDYSYDEYLEPDIEVRSSLDDLYKGKDTVLETAIAYLQGLNYNDKEQYGK